MENGSTTSLGSKHENDELVDAPLVAECEWGNKGDIEDDFEKLLLARAGVRLMIFDEPISKGMAERLAEKVRKFNGSRAEDAWLLASWEKSGHHWSCRYFTITPATGTLRAFDTSGNPSPLP